MKDEGKQTGNQQRDPKAMQSHWSHGVPDQVLARDGFPGTLPACLVCLYQHSPPGTGPFSVLLSECSTPFKVKVLFSEENTFPA